MPRTFNAPVRVGAGVLLCLRVSEVAGLSAPGWGTGLIAPGSGGGSAGGPAGGGQRGCGAGAYNGQVYS